MGNSNINISFVSTLKLTFSCGLVFGSSEVEMMMGEGAESRRACRNFTLTEAGWPSSGALTDLIHRGKVGRTFS